ncbi:MAG: hypothetical protein ACRYGP_13965 [Janthinobacterium lividum]
MSFDSSIGLGSILIMITMVVGGLGAFFTLRGDSKETGKRVSELEAAHDRLGTRFNAFELSVAKDAKDYVNRVDLKEGLKEVEGRLGKRLDDVEHTVRNSATRMVGELKDVIRNDPRRGANQ